MLTMCPLEICQDVLSVFLFINLYYTFYEMLITPTHKTLSGPLHQYHFVGALYDGYLMKCIYKAYSY
jgi:hypothetical protein